MQAQEIKKLKAYTFAERKHEGQKRKDGKPYITHPENVALILLNEFGITDREIIEAALLHDTIEDTDTTYDEIKNQFGEKVADYVLHLTKPDNENQAIKYWESLKQAPDDVKKIKIADRIHNLRTSDFSKLFQDRYLEKTKKYIFPVANLLGGKFEQKLIQTVEKIQNKTRF